MVGKIACLVLLCMVVVASHRHAEAALTCAQVQLGVVRCLPYLTNHGPLGGCCPAFKGLWSAATTPQDRRTACTCLKAAANAIKGIDFGKAAALPGVCHVNLPYKLSLSTDCSKIQ